MSLDFDGVDDIVNLASQTLGTTLSMACWIQADNQGELDEGKIFEFGTAGAQRWAISWNGTAASKKLYIAIKRASADGVWTMTSAFTNVTGWKFVGFKLDNGLTTNDPTMYVWEPDAAAFPTFTVLTVGSGLTETSTPNGALSEADTQTVRVGSRSSGASSFNGRIGEFALYTSLLGDADFAAIAHLGPMAVPGMFLYWPMDLATGTDFSGNARNGTITGAVAGENPPSRPAGRKG
jgi:hypothetical protein